MEYALKTREVEKVIMVDEKVITLTLTQKEAASLWAVCRVIGGPGNGNYRPLFSNHEGRGSMIHPLFEFTKLEDRQAAERCLKGFLHFTE